MWTRKYISVVTAAVALALISSLAAAVDTKKAPSKTAAKKPAAAKQPRGRLPAYYRQVVDDRQRDAIYAVQAKYRADRDKIAEEIKKVTADLRKKLLELKEAQDQEVEAVLSEEQLAKVQKFRDEAAAKRKSSSSSSSRKVTAARKSDS